MGAWESDLMEMGKHDEGNICRRIGSWRGDRVRDLGEGKQRGGRRRTAVLHRPINTEQQQPAADTTDTNRYSIEQQLGQVL